MKIEKLIQQIRESVLTPTLLCKQGYRNALSRINVNKDHFILGVAEHDYDLLDIVPFMVAMNSLEKEVKALYRSHKAVFKHHKAY